MTENNNQKRDIWLNAKMNPGTGLLETEAQGSPSGLTVLLGAALARIAHEEPNPPQLYLFLDALHHGCCFWRPRRYGGSGR